MKRQVDPSSPCLSPPSIPPASLGKLSNGFKTNMWSFILVFFFCSVFDMKNAELFFCLPATLIQ